MKSLKAQILEAYSQDLQNRFCERSEVKKGDLVETHEGERYVVIESSNKLEDVQKYDSDGTAKSYKKNVLMESETTWVAFKNEMGDLKVLPYGEDGVTLVGTVSQKPEHTRKFNSIMEAYYAVINENGDSGVEVEINVDGGDGGRGDEEEEEEEEENGEEENGEEEENGALEEGKVNSKEELKEYAMELAKAAFGDEADESIVDDIVNNAAEKAGDDWGKAVGIVKNSFTG